MSEKIYEIGYTQGVFDMFHIGHLAIIKRAAQRCRKLIVGVNSDVLVVEYKNKKPVIYEKDRAEIVRSIKYVDRCEIVNTLDKMVLEKMFGFNAVFIGDDWRGKPRWEKTEEDLARIGVDVVYLPHTPQISSSLLRIEVPNRVE